MSSIVPAPPSKRLTQSLNGGIPLDTTNVESNPLEISPDLGEQTGYASANNSNFSILQRSLQHQDDVSSTSDQPKRHMPDFVLYQISQIERQLPSQAAQARLIDVYLDHCWWWFHGVDPIAFRQTWKLWHTNRMDASGDHGKDNQHFSALLFQVIAVSLQYLQTRWVDIWKLLGLRDRKSADSLSARYSNSGVQIMDLIGRHDPTITAVQHDMVRGVWLKNASRGTESWYSLGHAVRQAQELRLHLKEDPPASLADAALNEWLWQDELRKRIWVCLFDWDAHVALTLGRPRIINAGDCVRMHILECDYPEDPRSCSPAAASKSTPKPCMITVVRFHNDLGYMLHQMVDRGIDKPTLKDYSVLDELHKDTDALLGSVSPYFRYESPDTSWDELIPEIRAMRLHLVSLAHTYLVALHRAHVLRRPKSCEAAIIAALQTLTAQEELLSITDEQKWRIYTYSFYTIDASIFLAALLLEQPPTFDRKWTGQINVALQKSLDRLGQTQEVSPMARAGYQVLNKCQDRLKRRESLVDLSVAVSQSANGNSNGAPTPSNGLNGDDPDISSSLKTWIEQMDQVMLPLSENDPSGPFDDTLWDMLLET